jgi:hypothetical protein
LYLETHSSPATLYSQVANLAPSICTPNLVHSCLIVVVRDEENRPETPATETQVTRELQMSVMTSEYMNTAHYFRYFGSEYILKIYGGPRFKMSIISFV